MLDMAQVIERCGLVEDRNDRRWKDDPDKRVFRGSRYTAGLPHGDWQDFDQMLGDQPGGTDVYPPRSFNAAGWYYVEGWNDGKYRSVWINDVELMTFTYCEGDLTLVVCGTPERYRVEMAQTAEFYGRPAAPASGQVDS